MLRRKAFFLYVVLFIIVAIFAFITMRSGDTNEIIVHTDIQPLSTRFDLSRLPDPINVQWVQQVMGGGYEESRITIPGPTDYIVTAILEYDTSTDMFIEQLGLEVQTPSRAFFWEDWMPEDLVDVPKDQIKVYYGNDLITCCFSLGSVWFIENYVILFGGTT